MSFFVRSKVKKVYATKSWRSTWSPQIYGRIWLILRSRNVRRATTVLGVKNRIFIYSYFTNRPFALPYSDSSSPPFLATQRHTAGVPPPFRLRRVPHFLSREELSIFLPSLTRVELCVHTILGASCRHFSHRNVPLLGGFELAVSTALVVPTSFLPLGYRRRRQHVYSWCLVGLLLLLYFYFIFLCLPDPHHHDHDTHCTQIQPLRALGSSPVSNRSTAYGLLAGPGPDRIPITLFGFED